MRGRVCSRENSLLEKNDVSVREEERDEDFCFLHFCVGINTYLYFFVRVKVKKRGINGVFAALLSGGVRANTANKTLKAKDERRLSADASSSAPFM